MYAEIKIEDCLFNLRIYCSNIYMQIMHAGRTYKSHIKKFKLDEFVVNPSNNHPHSFSVLPVLLSTPCLCG